MFVCSLTPWLFTGPPAPKSGGYDLYSAVVVTDNLTTGEITVKIGILSLLYNRENKN